MASRDRPKANDLFTALAHPLRRKILRRMLGQEGETTPRELSAELGEPLSALSYHVRVLAECGAVKLKRTQKIRGATQHFYRTAIKADWARLALAAEESPKKSRRRGEEKG
jgi:DNA-binding transcriptional ArsR family regulator